MDKRNRTEVTFEGAFVGDGGTVRNFYVRDFSYDGKDRDFEAELEELRGRVVAAKVSEHSKNERLVEAFGTFPSGYRSFADAGEYGATGVLLTGTISELVPGYKKMEVVSMEVE